MDHLGRVSQEEYRSALDRRDRRIAELEATVHMISNSKEYADLVGYHSGVRSVYGQAVYEGRNDVAEWLKARWPGALQEYEETT